MDTNLRGLLFQFDSRGNYTYPQRIGKEQPIVEFKELPVEFTNDFIKKIKVLCELHDIKLVFYFSPINGQKVVTKPTDCTIVNHSDLLKNTTYFYDVIHVNHKGRQVSSVQFAIDFKNVLY
jgi:hypothetical protein